MKKSVKRYFDDTIALMSSISVNINKKEVGLFKGIEEACRRIKLAAKKRKKVIFIGNGGSAAIASHMAIDFWKNGHVKALAFNDGALLTCLSNDYGYDFVFEKPIEAFAEKGDLLIAISSSGRSKNILNGVKMAKQKGCQVITLSGFKRDNPLNRQGRINFYIPSNEYGPVEVLHQFICHYVLDILMDNTQKG